MVESMNKEEKEAHRSVIKTLKDLFPQFEWDNFRPTTICRVKYKH